MKAKEWERVVHALVTLGCEIFNEDDDHVHLAYKATYWQAVPKRPLSATIQRMIIRALDIDELEYVDAMTRDG